MSLMNYRREIDGLRALAVLPVIFFHAGFDTFRGGFVGVDVFFVISGYLITSIIISEKEAGVFTLKSFYERRARRILPALFVVMTACLFLAWFTILPSDIKDFSRSLIYVPVFLSNVLFSQQTGYFDTSSELKPLLHTWSLAVEEQYYVLFPLFMLLLWKYKRDMIPHALAAIGVASLAYAHHLVGTRPESAFFLLPSRIWELLIGASLAWLVNQRRISISKSQLGSATGLMLLLYAVFAFGKNTPFPGLSALVPTIGAALIILFATPTTFVGYLLGSKALVGLGLISYSLYLWHQPLFAFARHKTFGAPGSAVLAASIFAAITLAYLTWRFVEQPVRQRRVLSKRGLIVSSIAISAIFLAIGTYGKNSEGFPKRFPALQAYLTDAKWPETYNFDKACLDQYGGEQYCKIFDPTKPPTDALIGDSHANHFFFGLASGLSAHKRNLLMQGAGGCPPFIGIDIPRHPHHGNLRCFERTNQLYENILTNTAIKNVYLSFHRSSYFDEDVSLVDVKNQLNGLNRREFVAAALARTIKTLEHQGKKVTIIFDMPDLHKNQPIKCLLEAPDQCGSSTIFTTDFLGYEALISSVRGLTSVRVFDTHKYLSEFPISVAGEWFYRDSTHLSYKGSMFFADKFERFYLEQE